MILRVFQMENNGYFIEKTENNGYFISGSDEEYNKDCNSLQTHIDLMGGAEYGV